MVTFSAIDLEVGRHQFQAIADEMGAVLRRTAYSPNIKERADFSVALFVPNGELLAQVEHIPVHLGSMPASVLAVVDAFGDRLDLGAQYAVNDPYHGGTHLNDLTLVRPVAIEGDLIGWVANRAHHADVGGTAPGSMPADATLLAEEGHIVPPTVAVREGQWVDEFLAPFLAATRTPAERAGDLSAQLGANEIGARRLLALAGTHGPGKHTALGTALLAYGERRMLAAVGALPDGRYEFEDHMETATGVLVPIRVAVTISGRELHADFAGTADQLAANFNTVEAVAASCLYYAIRVATDPTIPTNGGCYRPITLAVPSGSMLNPVGAAAVAAGNVETSQRLADVVLGALAPAAPERIPAASQGTMNNILVGSDTFAYYETLGGGQGGRPTKPGQSGIQTGMTNTKNTPIESIESHYPIRVARSTLRRGSGGRGVAPRWGRHRAGVGVSGAGRALAHGGTAAHGTVGAARRLRGAPGEDWLIRGGQRERLPSKVTFEVEPGDRLLVRTPGGGGWGVA